MRELLLSTLGMAATVMFLVALADIDGYSGPVALELQPVVASQPHSARPSWKAQIQSAKSIVGATGLGGGRPVARKNVKAKKATVAGLQHRKMQELIARQRAVAARILMQGAKAPTAKKLAAFRPVHLFGGEFAKQEAAREHKRSASQELSHLSKLNAEIFGAAPKKGWKVETAAQELASFGEINNRVVGDQKYPRMAADSAAKELAADRAINAKVFQGRRNARSAFKGESAAAELKSLRKHDDVVPEEDMSSSFGAYDTKAVRFASPHPHRGAKEVRLHPTLAAKRAKGAVAHAVHVDKKV